jgi:hypothetical protein
MIGQLKSRTVCICAVLACTLLQNLWWGLTRIRTLSSQAGVAVDVAPLKANYVSRRA